MGEYGWLHTKYSFSFADWHNEKRMGFGVLRVLNDDVIEPGSGFGTHSHSNMEIITIVSAGTLTHTDSLGNTGEVKAGEIQVMSAGAGVTHSEYNNSKTEPLRLFQIWLFPKKLDIAPSYRQVSIAIKEQNQIIPLVIPSESKNTLSINQDAFISEALIDTTIPLFYSIQGSNNGVYFFVIEGEVYIAGEVLTERDAIGLTELSEISIMAKRPSKILLFDVPMNVTYL